MCPPASPVHFDFFYICHYGPQRHKVTEEAWNIYARYADILQSSSMGKSHTIDELPENT